MNFSVSFLRRVVGKDGGREGGVLTENTKDKRMRKESVAKDDGRYIIFYSFEEDESASDEEGDS